FFDIDLKLKKIVTPENALEAVHEHELNNMILGSVTMDMAYAKAFIDDVDHFGYYWRGNFYLHRIRRVEDSHINETVPSLVDIYSSRICCTVCRLATSAHRIGTRHTSSRIR